MAPERISSLHLTEAVSYQLLVQLLKASAHVPLTLVTHGNSVSLSVSSDQQFTTVCTQNNLSFRKAGHYSKITSLQHEIRLSYARYFQASLKGMLLSFREEESHSFNKTR